MKKFSDYIFTIIFFNSTLFFPSVLQAVVVSGLYEAEIAVSEQTEISRKKNIAAALRVVLAKLTGDRYVPFRNEVTALLLNAEQYVQQFEYRTNAEKGGSKLYIWVKFNSASLDKVLHEATIQKWGRERPSTLVWLAVSDNTGRRLPSSGDVTAYNVANYVETMEVQAKNRGIVLVHPLLDLEDTNQLHFSDIWGGFQKPILTASRRYNADTVLTGRLENISLKSWQARWTAYIDKHVFTWVTKGALAEIVIFEGLDGLADILAEQYGHVGTYTQSGEIEIIVNNITNYNQYLKVLNYLESLNSVTKVEVKEVNQDNVIYFLTMEADVSAISKTVNLGQILKQISESSYRLVQ